MPPQSTFLTPRQLSDRWEGRIAVKTLANWRCADIPRGPTFRRLGNSIYYAMVDIVEFERATSFRSTKEYETAGE